MRINHLNIMSVENLREAADAIAGKWDAALAEYKAFMGETPRRMNAAQKQRAAYLAGVVAGCAQATREIEKRAPLILIGSGDDADIGQGS